jgi:hypothetical protein
MLRKITSLKQKTSIFRFLFLIIFLPQITNGSITTVKSVRDGLAKHTNLKPTDLIVLDLDNTLIYSPKQTDKNPVQLHQRLHFLTDEKLPELFTALHIAGIPLIGLTHAHTGAYRGIKSMEEWRFLTTSSLGLIFSYDEHTAKQPLDGLSGPKPVFYRGIILTAHQPKGLVLNAFLKHMNLSPKRIFFFDDQMRNINSVNETLSKKTELYCFHINNHTPSKETIILADERS